MHSFGPAYAQWGRDCGSDILHATVFGKSVIVINSIEIATDLLERRSLIYSSRPSSIMVGDLMGWHWHLALLPYGKIFRAYRRLFHREFNPRAVMRFRPLQLKATRDMLQGLADSPDEFFDHLVHMSGKTIMGITYGIDVKSHDDPYIAAAERADASLFAAGRPGAFYVDFLPFLRYLPEWMPGAGFKTKAKEWRNHADAIFNLPYEAAKQDYLNGTSRVSFISQCLEALDKNVKDFDEFVVKGTAASMYNAAVDTTASVVKMFVLAMIRNPDVQEKAQKELDEVVGRGSLPDFDHESSLPYVSAVVKEVFRWQPVTPIPFPHMVTAEDAYNGYRIPANSLVIPNIWAMLHNESVYPNPSSFIPERFLDSDGHLDPTVPDPSLASFGFGRRICPGRYLGWSSVWISIASILATFNIEKAVDTEGSPIEPSSECKPGIVASPLPFPASIKPRSAVALSAIQAAAHK
ncbi:hypothetical protein PLICRDRAFT_178958 [Plicaturopsis crispa FD-325 SS-3]|uniref:Unplaced genomic scaffold PLICRscaffold_15, whole genome shotgun sequence n=1 Tax=Plicaturopsis crispa FD-325 SS-3 TaxID=944288 RepID=A0A0C9T7E9_PLICR|nr:hypothetical protein PLICRDRAFT_178958 [Plicaturopsis crispa FD-325 SS-3]